MLLKKCKQGKVKRHKFRRQLRLTPGFGKPWSAPSIAFRVEFAWVSEDGEESNEQVHWVECRKFSGEERRHLTENMKLHANSLAEKETIESIYTCIYVAAFLCQNRLIAKINQAFVYPPATKKGSETIRFPLYKINWSEDLEKNSQLNKSLAVVLKNCIWHKF